MKTRTLRIVTLGTALVMFTAQSAFAQPKPAKPKPAPVAPAPAPEPAPPPVPAGPPSLSETLTGDAKGDYESGKLLFGDGDFAGSLIKFKSAYDKSKDARLLYNQAACEKNLRHYSKALVLLRQYQADGGTLLTEQDKTEANELIKAMEPFTAKLEIKIDEPDAEVSLDDEVIGTSPVKPVVVDIGTRRLRVKKNEFEEVSKEVAVGGSAQMTVEVKLVKIVHEGRINVKASNNGTISIDDKVVGSGTWSGVLSSGGHTLKVTAPKFRTHQTEVVIQDKQTRDVNVTLEAEPSKGVPAWVWITGGIVVAAGAATAIGFAAKGNGSYDGPQGNLTPGFVTANAPITFR